MLPLGITYLRPKKPDGARLAQRNACPLGGLSLQISLKIGGPLGLDGNIDNSLKRIKDFDSSISQLQAVEKEFVIELQEYL